MTQEIIEMARQAGFKMENSAAMQAAKAFYKLATAKEREAFKQIIRETPFSNWFQADVIEAIDKRGQA
jgi:hypothetical protein